MSSTFARMFALSLLSTAANVSAQDCHLALRGRVTEADQSEPLAFATIYIKEAERGAQTDENGQYVITGLCEGTTYTVSVSHVECEHAVKIVRLLENTMVDFNLSHHALVNEVVIVEKAIALKTAQAESVVSRQDLEAAKGVNLAETVRNLPGVTLLNTGATIAKPVIQGLHSNRIAIINGGTALEGQQWGSEHAPEIDPFTADKISVVKGAAAVRYGIGALGGAIVIEPEPLREKAGFGGWMALGGFSNGRGGVMSGLTDWRLKGRSLTFRLQGTAKRTGNLRAPDYFLDNTGTEEYDFSGKAGWKHKQWTHEITASQFNQRIAILRASHIGNVTDLQLAINSPLPLNNRDLFAYQIARPFQQIQHSLLKYKTLYRMTDKWKLTSAYSFQYNKRREYDAHPPLSDPNDLLKKPQISFRIWSNTVDVAAEHFPIRHWQGGLGVQGLQQLNYVGKGGLIPDYLTLGGGIWATERWRRYPNPWEFEVGLRYDYRWSHVTDTLDFARKLDTKIQYGNLSGTLGAIYHFSQALTATFNTGYAQRPPHVNELFARGVHHGAATFEEGQAGLTTEKAWNTNLSFSWQSDKLQVSSSVFRNQISDYIYLDPQQKPVLTVRGAFPYYKYAQTNAVLRGMDAQVQWNVSKMFALEGKVSLLRGHRLASDSVSEKTHRDWLPLMPTDRLQYGLKWSPKGFKDKDNASVRLMATTVLQQTRIPAIGLVKVPPPTFTTLALDAAHTVHWKSMPIEMGLTIQNLANVRYREYLDFFRFYADAPGVNVAVRAKLVF